MPVEQSVAEVVAKYDREARFRKLSGAPGAVAAGVAVGLSLFQLYTAGTGPLEALKQRSLHLTCIMVLAFLLYPATSRSHRAKPAALETKESETKRRPAETTCQVRPPSLVRRSSPSRVARKPRLGVRKSIASANPRSRRRSSGPKT